MMACPYSGWAPANTTTPGAGARTSVPTGAPMSRPLWNSDFADQGEERAPKLEFTGPRTGQRDGSAASTRVARLRKRSRERRSSPSSFTTPVRRSSSSPMAARSDDSPERVGPVPPPMPAPRLAEPFSGPEGEIVGVDDGYRDGQRDHEGQHGEDQPPRERETGDAPPVTMDHEEVELAASPHPPQRLRGTTESSRAGVSSALGWAFVIRQCPSNSTPSSTTTRGDSTSPKTRAVRLSSTRSVQTMVPTTSPLTWT